MSIMRRGELAGILCLIALILGFSVGILFGVGESKVGDILNVLIYLVVCATYFTLLLAVLQVVKSVGDSVFIRRMRHFFIGSVTLCLPMIPLNAPLFTSDLLDMILGLFAIVSVALLGVLSIRVAPFFATLTGGQAESGKKAAWWLKISGWLMATVVLSIVGIFASLVADFYMWRLVKQERIRLEGR